MISDLMTESWTAQTMTEAVDSGGAITPTFATDTTIGASGVFVAHSRRLSASEINARSKPEIFCTHRLYCTVSGITEKHRLSDPNGDKWNVVAVEDPHNLGEFYQIDLTRSDAERVADT
jgi:hypothetical protein